MASPEELKQVWLDLAALIEKLPPEEALYYQRGILVLAHDIRAAVGIIYSAENLLRRDTHQQPDDTELLDLIHTSAGRTMELLTDFAHPFDTGITVPLGLLSSKKKKE